MNTKLSFARAWVPGLLGLLAIGVGVATSVLLVKSPSIAPDSVLVKTPLTSKKGIVFLGDSLAQGVGATASNKTLAARVYAKESGDVRLFNFAIAGATVKQVYDDQLPRVVAITPTKIYLVVGSNDVTTSTDPTAFQATYDTLLRALVARHVPVVVLNIPDLSSTPAIPADRKEAARSRTILLNQIIATAAQNSGATSIEAYTFSKQKLTKNSGLLSDDGYHPNDEGYRLLANLVTQ